MAARLTVQPIDLEVSVRSKFGVKGTYQLPEGEMEFSVEYRPDSKERFVELWRELAPSGFTPRLVGTKDQALLFIRKKAVGRQQTRIRVILALLTLGSVVVFGLFLGLIYQQYAPSMAGSTVVILYGAAVLAAVAAHELGHMYVSRKKAEAPPAPYFVPGIPGITGPFPTLGIISRQREPAVNRDRFFDVIFAGPLLGLAVALVLYLLGSLVTVQSAVPLQSCQQVNGSATLCPSVIQIGLDSVVGPLLPHVAAGYSLLSPLADGATVGFLLTFVGLLPMVAFDGGHLAGLVIGPGALRVTSYLSVLMLISVDLPTYWAPAVVALLLLSVHRGSEPWLLDELSPMSGYKRWLYLGALALAFLCLPLPQTIAGFSLG